MHPIRSTVLAASLALLALTGCTSNAAPTAVGDTDLAFTHKSATSTSQVIPMVSPDGTSSYTLNADTAPQAQTFVAPKSGTLTAIDLHGFGYQKNLFLNFYATDSRGYPTGNLLGSGQGAPFNTTGVAPDWGSLPLLSPLQITEGKSYTFVIEPVIPHSSTGPCPVTLDDAVTLDTNATSGLANGRLLTSSDLRTWIPNGENYSLAFRLVMQ